MAFTSNPTRSKPMSNPLIKDAAEQKMASLRPAAEHKQFPSMPNMYPRDMAE